ncbi:MAG: M20/M25/M40 family metallo-hydrolase [Pseudomonadota bacterium]
MAHSNLPIFRTLLGLLVIALPAAAQLDRTERVIVAAVDDSMASAHALLEETVNVNSGTMNFAGVRAVGDLMAPGFEALGFNVTWYDGKPFGRAGHLLAERDGDGPRVLLIGHLDTVFEPDSPFQKYERDGDEAAGPGTTDMKGGNIVMLHALQALAEAKVLDRLSVRVVIAGDEEKRGRPLDVATAPIVDGARWADVAIGFEDGDGNPETAVISRRGASGWQLEVTGRPAHSSQIFRDGYGFGAVFEAARILDGFREALASVPNLTFNPGVIVGGTEVSLDREQARGDAYGKSNVIAETVLVQGDIRALSQEQLQGAKATMAEIASTSLPETAARLTFDDGYPPMAPTDGNRALLAIYDQASRDLGFGPVAPVDPRKAGAADISFAADHVAMAMDGIGLMGRGGHTVDEVADLTTFDRQIKRAALLLYRLSQRAP